MGGTTTWGDEEARRRIARAVRRGETSLWLPNLRLLEVPEELRQIKNLRAPHLFTVDTHWRTGAVLAHPDRRHRALIRADRHRNTVEVTVRGPSPSSLFAVLNDGLSLTLDRYPGLNINRVVPCQCGERCTELFDYEDLQRRIERVPPRLEIECRKSGDDVHVPLLLLGLPPSERDEIRSALARLEEHGGCRTARASTASPNRRSGSIAWRLLHTLLVVLKHAAPYSRSR
jgi:hypothetical protein